MSSLDDETRWGAIVPAPERMRWIAHNVLPHEATLRAWLRRRAVSGLETDDVIQETYVVLARLESVQHITAPRAYAYRVAQSIVRRHLRRAQIVPMRTMNEVDADTTPLDEASPEQHVAARLQLQRVAEVVNTLPPKCRQTFVLRKFEGLSQRDVAQRMGVAESTVEKHMARALVSLMAVFRHGEATGAKGSEDQGAEGAQLP